MNGSKCIWMYLGNNKGFKEWLKLTTKDKIDSNKIGKRRKWVAYIKIKMSKRQQSYCIDNSSAEKPGCDNKIWHTFYVLLLFLSLQQEGTFIIKVTRTSKKR